MRDLGHDYAYDFRSLCRGETDETFKRAFTGNRTSPLPIIEDAGENADAALANETCP